LTAACVTSFSKQSLTASLQELDEQSELFCRTTASGGTVVAALAASSGTAPTAASSWAECDQVSTESLQPLSTARAVNRCVFVRT